jgi:SAM-dependent methyltransferase
VTGPEIEEAGDPAATWLGALEARHLADLRPAEVGRALRALSSAYVERRGRLARGAALDGAGKRAAFALVYGPLHFLAVRAIVRALGAAASPLELIADLGCGTGVAGAAWALECASRPRVFGIERHPWAADEARWTCRTLGLDADVRCGDLTRVRLPARASAVVAAYTANELSDDARAALLRELLAAHVRGTRALVVEPIAKSAVPWWPAWAAAFAAAGGREDEWRFPVDLPAITGRLGRAAGLDHRELTARSLYLAHP